MELSKNADAYTIAKFNKVNELQSFEEAYNQPDKAQRDKWRNTIQKEFYDIKKRGVWEIIKKKGIPADCRCVKRKWIFKIKRNVIAKIIFVKSVENDADIFTKN